MYNQEPLFSKHDLRAIMEATKAQMLKEIEAYPPNQLLNTSLDDLATYFATKFAITPINIVEDQIRVDQLETKVDVSRDPLRSIPDRNRGQFYIPGTLITLYVPFEGDPDIFMCKPSTFTLSPPHGHIQGNVLELAIPCTGHDAKAVRGELDHLLRTIREYLEWAKTDLNPFNAKLKDAARHYIEARQQKLLRDQGLVASLGFPLREHLNAPTTYPAPRVRRKVAPKPPQASTKDYIPEPTLEMAEYENILSIIQQTATMLERSPQAFRGMNEESLRDQFLVPLNSHYEGQATGETFNFSGKTDILIRDGDRSVFVAECKIWRGAKSVSDAIDQLLGYATWRDTKTAILVFNRNKELSRVLNQIPGILKSHPNFKREIEFVSQTGFRCVLAHKDDPNREIILTVLVFDVPSDLSANAV